MGHTQGPWRAKPYDGQVVINGVTCYMKLDFHAVLGGRCRYNPDDIRLMAAAPELLAVVRMAIDYANDTKDRFGVNFGGDDAESYDKLMDAADAAINKAEGRSE